MEFIRFIGLLQLLLYGLYSSFDGDLENIATAEGSMVNGSHDTLGYTGDRWELDEKHINRSLYSGLLLMAPH